VFINSSQGIPGRTVCGSFGCIQQALTGIADQVRQEVNSDGVRVLSIYLGRTATPRMKALFELEGRPYQPELLLQPEDVAEVVLNSLAMPRRVELTNVEMRPSIKS
jgi:NADP-dependent 3-hydroxy acid dehydrogenase YdfG